LPWQQQEPQQLPPSASAAPGSPGTALDATADAALKSALLSALPGDGAQMQGQQEQQMEQKRVMMKQILEPEAFERLNMVGLVKPQKQLQIEAMILQLVQAGGVRDKISDAHLIQLIEKLDGAHKPATSSIKVQRKRRDDDSDGDIDFDQL